MASKVGIRELTALDLIKGLSMFVMITDHIGYYFFPGELWLRAFGRIDFPVWFFLPGYAKSRTVEKSWWTGGLLLMAANIVAGFSLLPANAVFTIMIIRLTIDKLTAYMMSDRIRFWVTALIFAALFPFTALFFEYGTLGLIIGVLGWLCRHRGERPDAERLVRPYGIFCWLAFSALEQYKFQFDIPQFLLMSFGTGMYLLILYLYRPRTFPRAAQKLGRPLVALIQFLGRYTLEVYVFHLMLFKAIKLWLHPELLMQWGLFVGKATYAPI